jgi:Cytochrome c
MFPRPPHSLVHRRRRAFQIGFFSVIAYLAFALILTCSFEVLAQDNKSQNNNPQHANKAANTTSEVARGKYLVESVAMCGQCHTPRDSNGNPDPKRALQGAPVPFVSPTHDPNWPISAPRIGGNPPADDADMVKLLTTGIWTTGDRLRPPMPQFRMDRSDAEAVVAYLKSLTAQE